MLVQRKSLNMKTIAIVLCTVYFASYAMVRSEDEMPPMCLEKMGITIDELPGLFHDQSDEATRKRGCLEACAMQKFGLMDGNTINTQKIDDHIGNVMTDEESKEEATQAIHQCITEATNDDECLVAASFTKCTMNILKHRFKQLISEI